jgi:hypothetical protein
VTRVSARACNTFAVADGRHRDSHLTTEACHASSWTHNKIVTTSTGTASGTVEVAPYDLSNFGSNFGVYLEP